MAYYPPPSEVDMIFDPVKFRSLPQIEGTSIIIDSQITAAQQAVIECNDIIDGITGIQFIGNNFWKNQAPFTSNQTTTFSFSGFVVGATYLVDFQLGLMSGGWNGGSILYGFKGTTTGGCAWSIGATSSTAATNYTGNFPIMPRSASGTPNPCFINSHVIAPVTVGSSGTIYLFLSVYTVNNSGVQTNGTYGVNCSASPSTQTSPYDNQSNKSCKFIRIN